MKKFKRGMAFVLTLCMIFSIFTNVSVAQAATKKNVAKTVTVKTQEELDKALKDGKATKIKIVTGKNVKLVIPKGTKTSGVQLVIDAPKATIVNEATFEKISITGKGAKSYTESGKNNVLVVSADSAKVTISKKATVKALTMDGAKATVTVNSGSTVKKVVVSEDKCDVSLKVNGKVEAVKVTGDASKVSIAGKAAKTPVTVTGDKALIVASTSVKLDVKSDAKVSLQKGAEGTTVKAADKVDVKIANKTDKKVTVTTPSGKTEVGAGKTVTDAAAQDKKEDEKKDEDKKDDEKKPEDEKKPADNTSGSSGSNGGYYEPQKDLSYNGYDLKWEDEFNGNALNRENWNVELHEPGWVNAEWQEYVDSEENIQVKDGNLVIKPVKKVSEDGKATYTSGRVNTQNKQDFKYGLFEARVKVPTGMGYLPAFWMMPTDENLYGQWPRCGEIDIMEVMGQDTKKAMGTIHYGNPHGQTQGEYTLNSGNFSSQWHTFSLEWEPGKLVWYVDGIKFHEANDWYTTTEGQGTVAYPAPFDQKFYMILNLAIGGEWVGYPDETTTYEDQSFEIDYVRAYQKPESYYNELEKTVQKPLKPEVVEPGEGKNYLKNPAFAEADDLTGKNGSVWQFMTQQNGEATAAVVADSKFGEGAKAVKISTTKAGTEDYSVQFVQANIPVKQGGKYKVTFDAYAAENRTMIVDVSAPAYNYARYLSDTKVDLTTEKQTYSYEFTVKDHDDANARLEFNLGKTDNISDVSISNVKFEKIGSEAIDTSKKVLTDGNYVYNGKFQEGTEAGKKYLQYWDITGDAAKTEYAVTAIGDGRRLKVTSKDCASVEAVQLKQTELPLTAGNYELSFDAQLEGAESATINVTVAGQKHSFTISNTKKSETKKLTFTAADLANKDIVFDLGVNGTVYLDNIRLVEDTLIKNGSFNADLAGFEVYAYDTSAVTYTVDSQTEDKAFDITIKDTNDADWKIQLKQNNVVLEKDQWYNLKFNIKSSIGRKISYAIQRNGAVHKDANGGEDWTPYVQDKVSLEASADGKYQAVDVNFKMDYETDEGSIFNIAMGAVDGRQITDQHRICIDNIVLTKIDEPKQPETEGVELINNGSFVNGTDGYEVFVDSSAAAASEVSGAEGEEALAVTISNTGDQDWKVQVKQINVPLQKGKTYKLSFKAKSTKDRSIRVIMQGGENKGWDVYSSNNIAALTNEYQTFTDEFTMSKDTDLKAFLSICLGKVDDVITEQHTIYIDDISLKQIGAVEEPENPVQPSEPENPAEPENPEEELPEIPAGTNLIKEADFVNGVVDSKKSKWVNTIANWDNTVEADAEVLSATNGAVTYRIKNTGKDDWNVQLKQNDVPLEAGKKYVISFEAESSMDRKIHYAVQKNGEINVDENGNADWLPYKKADVELTTNQKQTITQEFTMPANDKYAVVSFSLGNIGGQITTPHTVTLSAICVMEKNLLDNNYESWEKTVGGTAKGNVTVDGNKAIYTVDQPGNEEWNVKLSKSGLKLEAGKKYYFTFKATASENRTIKYAFQDNPQQDKYDWIAGARLDLKKDETQTVTATIDMTGKNTVSSVVFDVNMGILGSWGANGFIADYTPGAATITLSDFSLTEIIE